MRLQRTWPTVSTQSSTSWLEQACLAQGEQELELAAVCLATATRGILQTKPGREFARHILADPVRLPRKVIFHDDRPALPEEAFARHRFGQRALLALFGELYPAWNELEAVEPKAQLLKDRALLNEDMALKERLKRERAASQAELEAKHSPKLRASLAEKLKVQRYLENIGVKTTRTTRSLTGKQKATLRRRRAILEGPPRGPVRSRRARHGCDGDTLRREPERRHHAMAEGSGWPRRCRRRRHRHARL